ncbi:hypothetical protein HBI23_154140 [Parastagonospora nodorum]|nr:hypothetical protein HBI12_152480 [Parastagonospora nodorum]KAH5407221.1 hypothetical protein HBI46_186130 [Parastagonospora nodorum]KAH5418560.1 hypothetical protein HBI47_142080 [Parastagonospora nodorum]KAH5654618.1 hypothetical protein HBI23_154140 [Parastagonospora nodorum]KAH5770115.1 hypothetical protein HBI97_158880 [Parastagonospora nodorum]
MRHLFRKKLQANNRFAESIFSHELQKIRDSRTKSTVASSSWLQGLLNRRQSAEDSLHIMLQLYLSRSQLRKKRRSMIVVSGLSPWYVQTEANEGEGGEVEITVSDSED